MDSICNSAIGRTRARRQRGFASLKHVSAQGDSPEEQSEEEAAGQPEWARVLEDIEYSHLSGASGRYLYERLGEKTFQRLCNALLVHRFPGVTCMPVGHSDGGRDAMRSDDDRGLIVYQVKWAASPPRNPVRWLNEAINGERANIERLVAEGAESYVLLTSVAGTAVPGRGTIDKLREELNRHSATLGVTVECWWRANLDAIIDAAPDALKWSYGDMLAGWDLIRYLNRSGTLAEQDHVLRDLVRQIVATQWEEDSKVKFKQVDLASSALSDLFVDVEATRFNSPGSGHKDSAHRGALALGGAAAYLLKADYLHTAVLGAPGQGKSTLGQYLCQIHRAIFLDNESLFPTPPGVQTPTTPRLPLRVDLRDYALWLSGGDPFAAAAPRNPPHSEHVDDPSLESFLVRLAQAKSGATPVTGKTLQRIFARFPLLLVLDGLDEVAEAAERRLVVAQIGEFCARARAGDQRAQVVVTMRPNAGEFAEPSSDWFETISLQPLSHGLRSAYLDLWSRAQGLAEKDRESLRQIFDTHSVEPHVASLAENPMQLTILLFLILKRGESIPRARTELYSSYMQTFLDREAEKSAAVHRHRSDLEEVTAHLGWLLQEQSESGEVHGRLTVAAVKKSILLYLHDVGKDVTLVDDLFTAVTDRVWALSSKQQGTFQFDIQPLQEYFAAKHLYDVAGAGSRDFDKTRIFRQLVRRPYWMNNCRFYAGFATVSELITLADVLKEEFEVDHRPAHLRLVTWTLLADGVFSRRPRTQNEVAELLTSDVSAAILTNFHRGSNQLPQLSSDHGGAYLLDRFRTLISDRPAVELNVVRASLMRRMNEIESSFIPWWQEQMRSAAGGYAEAAWLHLTTVSPDIPQTVWHEDILSRLTLTAPAAASYLLATSAPIHENSPSEIILTNQVLNGHCTIVPKEFAGFPRQLLRVFDPRGFVASAQNIMNLHRGEIARGTDLSSPRRSSVLTDLENLVARDERFSETAIAMLFGKGQQNTTAPWANSARSLAAIYGPCWLAAEITVIGAASNPDALKTSADITPGSSSLGPATDYGRLLTAIRANSNEGAWWLEQFYHHPDPLSRCTWSLALVAAAAPAVVQLCPDLLQTAVTDVPPERLRALLVSSSNLGMAQICRPLDLTSFRDVGRYSPDVLLLLSHYVTNTVAYDPLQPLQTESLTAMASRGQAGWTAGCALMARLLRTPSEHSVKALQDCPSSAIPHFQGAGFEIPIDHARRIFSEPDRFPPRAVTLAERCLHRPFRRGRCSLPPQRRVGLRSRCRSVAHA